jgi:hypothetical protein
MATGLSLPIDVEEVEGGWLVACVGSHSVEFVCDGVGGDGGVRPSLGKAGGGGGSGDEVVVADSQLMEDTPEWRASLTVGSYCDAQDQYGKWFEAKVTVDRGPVVKVHFMGWEPKWDIELDRSSLQLQPHHAKVPNWRVFLVGSLFDMRGPDGKWYLARVEKVDREAGQVQLRPGALSALRGMGMRWYEFMR